MAKRGAYDKKIKVGVFAEMVQKELDQYCREIEKEVPDIVEKAGKKCAQSIRFHVAAAGIQDKQYGGSWKFQITERNGWLGTFGKVWSPKHYRIAHLLEHGHTVRNRTSGKVLGSSKAYPHLYYAEQEAVLFLENTLKKAIEGKE